MRDQVDLFSSRYEVLAKDVGKKFSPKIDVHIIPLGFNLIRHEWLLDAQPILRVGETYYEFSETDVGKKISLDLFLSDDFGNVVSAQAFLYRDDSSYNPLTENVSPDFYLALSGLETLSIELPKIVTTQTVAATNSDVIGLDSDTKVDPSPAANQTYATSKLQFILDGSKITNVTLTFKDDKGLEQTVSMTAGAADLSETSEINNLQITREAYKADIDLSDVLANLKHIVGLHTLEGKAFHAADVNNDASVNLSDVLAQLKHIVGLKEINTFDVVDMEGNLFSDINSATSSVEIVLNGDANLTTSLNDGYANLSPSLIVPIGGTLTEDAITSEISDYITSIDPEGEATIFSVQGSENQGGFYTVTGSYGILVLNAATGAYTYTLNNTAAAVQTLGASSSVTEAFSVEVTDGTNTPDAKSLIFSIQGDNDAPTVSSTATTSIDEDSTYSYTFTTNDIDVGDTVTLAAPNKPSWLSFDAATGVLSGTPSNDDVGDHSIVLTATDAAGAVVTQSFTLAVSNTNDAPTVANAIEYKTALVDTAVSFQLAANTFDDIDVADTLTYAASLSNGEPLPAWLSFNAASRTFSGTPTSSHLGSIDVTVTATDESFAVASDTFTMTVSGSPDIKRFSFGFKEEGGNLKRDILVEMSDNFSHLNEVSILYWEIGNQQSWITLTRDQNGLFTNTETVNRYLASGTYQVRQLNAKDDKGAVLAFTNTQIEDFGFDTIFELSNSLSDEIAPTIDSFSIGEFYYDEVNEVWKIDHTIKLSDNLSGINPVYEIWLGNPSGAGLPTQRTVNENGEATETRELPKYTPSGDYTLGEIRIYDLAGNNGSISGSQAAALAGKQLIKLENEFADNLAPTLTSFNLSAELNQSTGRPSVIIDFLANDTGGSGYNNSYLILLDPNGVRNDRWVDRDISEETGVQFKIDLPTEYVAGIFSVSKFTVRDNAANETQYTKSDLANLGFDSEINVYFAPENPGDNYIIEAMSGENWLIGTNLSDIFDGGSDKDIFIGGSGEDKFLFDINDFHSSVEQADVISDFTVGEDIIGLKDGLSFNELSIAQGSGEYASDTIISKKSDGEYLAILQAVDASLLDEADFTPVDIA